MKGSELLENPLKTTLNLTPTSVHDSLATLRNLVVTQVPYLECGK